MNGLTEKEIEQIDATMLPAFERHNIRLLAHCLVSFRSMADDCKKGPLPNKQRRVEWCLKQPALANEKSFIPIFLKQMEIAGLELEKIAAYKIVTPLELTLEDLIKASAKTA